MPSCRTAGFMIVGFILCGFALPAWAQLSSADIDALRAEGEAKGWTFTVSENPATKYSLEQLAGAVPPPNWQERAPWDPCMPQRDLPEYWDWRDTYGRLGVRDQGGCGSCWAFGAIGPMECQLILVHGMDIDLSEQWLVSCTDSGSCAGGWHTEAYEYMRCNGLEDPCGGSGPVLDDVFPYVAYNAECECPYWHAYCIDSWAAVGAPWEMASVEQIKQAIIDHGPVSTGVYVNSAFQAYDSGVFNACEDDWINHIVTLVGWDDSLGSNGAWLMRNSWGSGWGERGHMQIEYECCRIGYATCYITYTPPEDDCDGDGISDWQAIEAGLSLDCNSNGVPDGCDLESGTSTDCNDNVIIDECELADVHGLAGSYYGSPVFTGDRLGRIDPTVDFDWEGGGPWDSWIPQTFSIRWTGYLLTPDVGGEYLFHTLSNDGVRLWVNNQLLIDDWQTVSDPIENTGTIQLVGNRAYRIVLEYYEWQGLAQVTLSWQPPGQELVVIPTENLIPGRDCNDNGILDACDLEAGTSLDVNDNSIPDECEAPLQPGDLDCDGDVDFDDIDPFVTALAGEVGYLSAYPECNWYNADCDGDNDVDFDDIDAFVDLLGD